MAHALTDYRTSQGLSVSEFAEIAGTSRQTIYRIESGDQVPSPALAGKLQTITGIDARVLMKVSTEVAA